MIQPDQIILKHVVSEKATEATSHLNQYTFKVSPRANRVMVAQAIKKTFGVDVVRVNISNTKPKAKVDRSRRGRFSLVGGYKKAIVALKPGQSIELI